MTIDYKSLSAIGGTIFIICIICLPFTLIGQIFLFEIIHCVIMICGALLMFSGFYLENQDEECYCDAYS